MLKFCRKCENTKEFSLFPNCKSSKDGKFTYCKQCVSEQGKDYRSRNEKEVKLRKAAYAKSDKGREQKRKHRARLKDYYNEYSRKYYLNNKQKFEQYRNKFFTSNPFKRAQYSAYHRAVMKQRTLKGLTEDDFKSMQSFYSKCAEMSLSGEKYNVDHIVPLKGKNICGLHVPWNLQILSQQENQIKQRKFDGTYENESWRTQLPKKDVIMEKRKVRGGLKTKGMRVAPYDKRKDMENMNESAKQAPFHTEGAGKQPAHNHEHPGNKK